MNKFKSHFVFNRSQQNGIFLLVAIIVILQLVYFFYPFTSEENIDPEIQEQAEKLQKKIDSLKQASAAAEDPLQTLAAFNPNYLTDYRGYVLGMSPEEIDRLHDFRSKGLWVNSAEDFQEVTKVSDSLLKAISPFFQFPQRNFRASVKTEYPKKAFSEAFSKADLNSATAEELQKVNGIGDKLSVRIVNYRQSIGGFRDEIQLKDVYGLSPEVVERVLERFEVGEMEVQRQDLNTITVLELSKMPYFDYELARAIVDLRKKQKITSFEDLQGIKGFPVEKIDRIKLYLAID